MSSTRIFLVGLSLLAWPGCEPPPTALIEPPKVPSPPVASSPVRPAVIEPTGWFALGDPGDPPSATVVTSRLALAIDARGGPWFAEIDRRGSLRVGHVSGERVEIERLPGFHTDAVTGLGLGFQGEDTVLTGAEAAIAGRPAVAQIARRSPQGAWVIRDVHGPCTDALVETSPPSAAIDRAGHIVHACIQVRRPKRDAIDRTGMPSPPPPPHAAQLRVGHFVGETWHDLVSRAVPTSSQGATVHVDGAGEIDVIWDPGAASSLHIDGELRVSSRRISRPVAGPPRSGATGPEWPAFIASRGERRLGAFYESTLDMGSARGILAISDQGGPWRPLVGVFPPGVSAGERPALAPALALDRNEDPVVAWNEGGYRMAIRRWDGHAWVALPDVNGEGPHGLAVDPRGDVYIGSWSPRSPAPEKWTMHRIHDGAAEVASELRYQTPLYESWVLDRETRLRVDDRIHLAFFMRELRLHQLVLDERRATWDSDPGPTIDLPKEIRPLSSLAYHPSGRLFMAWADEERVHVASWDGARWAPFDDTLPSAAVRGRPTLAVCAHRVCVAWANESWLTTVFVRCHAAP